MDQNKGFSLTEIIIVLLIIGILCSFAPPNYHRALIKSHRSEATVALENLSLSLEHYYNIHHSYCGASLEKLSIPDLTKSRYYELSIQQLRNNRFVLDAKPLASQTRDTECGTLSLDSLGNEGASGYSSNPQQDCW
ncbi:MAG: pilE [Gammaproteobacteria bacterium]|jgi:type IV pilus assembly protein PilE|nr:pilE [Gammaproteobacteria bacterium]